jgi:tRNA (mo5U34)-methyltransferase
MNDDIQRAIKARSWFYEFKLPDGTNTTSVLPPHIRDIHVSRRDKLSAVIERFIPAEDRRTAIDFASHEGYYSFETARYFSNVIGFDVRQNNIDGARLMATALGVKNVEFRRADLQLEQLDGVEPADFMLAFGLFYHLENPVHVMRLASRLCRKHILIETQVTGSETAGKVELGSHLIQVDIQGTFAMVVDSPHLNVGGTTELSLVPSLNTLVYLLKAFGFSTVEVLPPEDRDYEQFVRGTRVVIYGRK